MTQNITTFTEAVLEQNPLHKKFMQTALSSMTPDEKTRFETYIDYCAEKGLDTGYLADCYMTIVEDTLREQMYFQRHGHYRHNSFADVANDVYFNDEYMSRYMYGLALTSFLWPNHLAMARFFNETLPTDKTGAYLEIGPGHGYYLMTAMARSAFTSFLGVDISKTSIEQTRALITHFAPDKKDAFDLKEMDFLDSSLPDNSFDAIVMGEVLEHVEKPDAFLKEIARIAKPDAYIFVTTCINAPAVDHIYLFKSPDELDTLFHDCSLEIATPCLCPYEGKTLEESAALKLPVNVAYVLRKT